MTKRPYGSILLAALVMMTAFVGFANAEDPANFPSHAIQLVVPYGAGGDTDLTARIAAKGLQEALDTPVVVLNVSGASGSIGATKVKDSDPDGYTLLFYHSGLLLNTIANVIDYSYKDFTPIAGVAFNEASVWVVNPASKYKTLKDLVEDAKQHPGEINFGVGLGSQTHAHAAGFQRIAGVNFNIVDVGGIAEKNVALMGNYIAITEAPLASVKSFLDAKRMRAIAVPMAKRYKAIADVPTIKESGYDFAIKDRVYFIMAPPNTPKAIADKLTAAIKTALDKPEIQKSLDDLTMTPTFLDGPAITKELAEQSDFMMQFQDDVIAGKKMKKKKK